MSRPTAAVASADHGTSFTGAARKLWDALPAFLVSGTAVCVVTAVVLWLVPGITPLSVLLYALLVGPLYGGLVQQTHAAVDGATPSAFSLPSSVRRTWRVSLGLFGTAAVAVALTLVAELVWARTGALVAAVPTGVGACVSVLLLVGVIVGMPLAESAPRLRGARLVIVSLGLTARRPVPVIAIVAVVVLGFWAASQFSGTLLFLLPAPIAIVSVLAVRRLREPYDETYDETDEKPGNDAA